MSTHQKVIKKQPRDCETREEAEALKIFFGDPDLGEQDVDQPEFTKGRGAGNGETWEHGCEPGSVGKNILAMLNPSTPEFFLAQNWGAGREQEGEGSHARASADVGRTWSRGADRGIIRREADTARVLAVLRPVPAGLCERGRLGLFPPNLGSTEIGTEHSADRGQGWSGLRQTCLAVCTDQPPGAQSPALELTSLALGHVPW